MTIQAAQTAPELSPDLPVNDPSHVSLNRLFVAGVVLRVCVFCLGEPVNADDHLGVIRYIVEHGSLATSNALFQSYHPPLYYVLMAPLLAIFRGALWPLHLFSLLVSCLNLWLIRRLMDDPLVRQLSSRPGYRVLAFALVATLTQLIVSSSYITNDTLTYLLGTLQCVALLRYVRVPTPRGIAWLALWAALGLLTKGTFIVTWVAIAVVILRTEWPRRGLRAATLATVAFAAFAVIVGGYKYGENLVRLGRPIVHNQEILPDSWYPRAIWHGLATVYDINIVQLIRHPLIQPSRPLSYALMMYATFWYSFLSEPSFRGNFGGYERVGSLTYAVAWIPTLLFAAGICVGVKAGWKWLRRDGTDDEVRVAVVVAIALFAANLAVVFAAGLKFNRWECFQSRLLLQSIGPMMLLFLAGARTLPQWKMLHGFVLTLGWATVGCALLYFLVEFALARHLLVLDETLLYQMHQETFYMPFKK